MKNSTLINEQGFSLIEGVVSSAIFLTCLMWALQYASQTQRIMAGQNSKIDAQAVLVQVLTKTRSQGSNFPRLLGPSGQTLNYVACYSRNGTPMPLSLGSAGSPQLVEGFVVMSVSSPDQLAKNADGSPVCIPPAVEVHFQPTSNPNEIYAVSILVKTLAESAPSASKIITNQTFSVMTRFTSSL